MNPLRQHREFIERSLGIALDELEHRWEKDGNQANPQKFVFDLRIQLADGQELACQPIGIFGTPSPSTQH
jgi:hypothetical protein